MATITFNDNTPITMTATVVSGPTGSVVELDADSALLGYLQAIRFARSSEIDSLIQFADANVQVTITLLTAGYSLSGSVSTIVSGTPSASLTWNSTANTLSGSFAYPTAQSQYGWSFTVSATSLSRLAGDSEGEVACADPKLYIKKLIGGAPGVPA